MPPSKASGSSPIALALLGGFITAIVDLIRHRSTIVFNLSTAAILGATIGTYLGAIMNLRRPALRVIPVGLFGGALTGLGLALLFRVVRGNNEVYIGLASEVFAGLSDSLLAFLIFALLFLVIGILTGLASPGANPREVVLRSLGAAFSCFVALVLGEKVLAITHSTSEVVRSAVAIVVLAAGFFPLVRRPGGQSASWAKQ